MLDCDPRNKKGNLQLEKVMSTFDSTYLIAGRRQYENYNSLDEYQKLNDSS